MYKLFTHNEHDFIPADIAFVYNNKGKEKSEFVWVLFHTQGTFSGVLSVQHDEIPSEQALKEMLSTGVYQIEQYRKELDAQN